MREKSRSLRKLKGPASCEATSIPTINADTINARRRVLPRREGREQVERESSIGREVEARVYALIAMRGESPGNPRTMEATYTPGRQKIARKDLPESRGCEEKESGGTGRGRKREDMPRRTRAESSSPASRREPDASRVHPVVKRITHASRFSSRRKGALYESSSTWSRPLGSFLIEREDGDGRTSERINRECHGDKAVESIIPEAKQVP